MTTALRIVLGLFFLGAGGTSQSKNICDWCVFNKASVNQEILAIGKISPQAQLEYIRRQGVCVKILDSQRKSPPGSFNWNSVEKSTGLLSEVTQLQAVMGKTLCQAELPIAKNCPTIVLANDAPRSTLIHEFLHYRQLHADQAWCALSKKLWTQKSATPDEYKKMRDKEWDVHQFLWQQRKNLSLKLEDEVTIASETLEEAEKRQSFDAEALNFVKRENIAEFLNTKITEYKKQLGILK